MFNLWLDYPNFQDEVQIVHNTTSSYSASLNKVLNSSDLIKFQELVKRVPVADNVVEFAVKVSNLTRPNQKNSFDFIKNWITWGAGPRASQYLILAAKSKAIIEGRFTPNIDDVKFSMLPVLRHRIITNFAADAEGISSVDIIKKLLENLD
jgi:MoxR-like ATPase